MNSSRNQDMYALVHVHVVTDGTLYIVLVTATAVPSFFDSDSDSDGGTVRFGF